MIRPLVAVAALLTGLGLIAGNVAADAAPVPLTNAPRQIDPGHGKLYDATVSRVDKAPEGAVVRIAGYLYDSSQVTDALLRAHKRGVHVRVVLHPRAASGQVDRLVSALGTDRRKGSWVARSRMSRGDMHAKVITVSQPVTVALGSANLAATNTAGSWNATTFYDGDRKLYDAGRKYVDSLPSGKPRGRTVTSGSVTVRFMPVRRDPILARLNRITDCRGVTILVAPFQWSDSRSMRKRANRLAYLARKGCDVRAVWNYLPHRILIGSRVGKTLIDSGVRVKNGSDPGYLHLKQMIITRGDYSEVWGGSANYLHKSWSRNADVITVDTSAAAYASAERQWRWLWATARPAGIPRYDGVTAAGEEQDADLQGEEE